jgi:hypothetical protein
MQGKVRVQHSMHRPGILRNGNRDGPRLVHSTLLEPVRWAITIKKKACPRRYHNYKDAHGQEEAPPVEFRLRMGQVGGVLVPISLFSLAFTNVSRCALDRAGARVGPVWHGHLLHLHVLLHVLRHSALTCNMTMRSTFAAAFPLFAGKMYDTLGTVGATVLLAGMTTAMAPLSQVISICAWPPALD